MTKVDNIIFCLRTANSENHSVNISKILSALTPEYIPGLFSFSIFFTLLDLDYSREHSLSVCFTDPDGIDVVKIENQTIPANMHHTSNLPNEYSGIHIVMDWNNVNLKSSGLYTIKIIYDENEIGSKSIYVKGKNE